jgi:hypothetical protein
MATFTPKRTVGPFSKPVTSDNPQAVLAWEETGVTFTEEEARVLQGLTNETTLEGCVKLGAERQKAHLWGHHERSSGRTDLVDDFEEEIAVFTQVVVKGDDGQSYHPFCMFSFWDDGTIHKSDGALFGLLDIERRGTLAAA